MLRDTMRIVIAAIAVVALAFLSSIGEGDDEDGQTRVPIRNALAKCPAFTGQGSEDWRESYMVAGPVGIRKDPPPLGSMVPTPEGDLGAKLGILVAGHAPVRISAPAGPRRILLFFGRNTGTIDSGRGFGSILFRPCTDRKRTVFPGGIRVEGRRAVRLKVRVIGRDGPPETLELGLPRTPNEN